MSVPDVRASPPAGDRRLPFVLALCTAVLLFAVRITPPAPFNLDETIDILMVEAARHGRLWIDNGHALYPSESLRLFLLREGPAGLVPQYPSGYAFLALPFYVMAGVRGLMLLNAVAYLAAMAATYGIARQLEASSRTAIAALLIFGFAGFGVVYAVGIWPHSLAVASVACAVLAVLRSTRLPTGRTAHALALGSGCLIGLGVNMRVDTILVAPAILLWLAARREHWTRAVAFTAGMMPGLLLASWLNHLKFDSWLPVDYGSRTGSTSLAAYWPLLSLAALALVVAIGLSSPRVRRALVPSRLLIVLLAGVVAVMSMQDARTLALRVATGAYALIVDFQAYEPPPGEAELFDRADSGELLVTGQLKRALVQSLPYLGVIPALLAVRRKMWRDGYALLLLTTLVWALPFSLRHWHGGSSPNMRYFLPVLPLIAVIVAICLGHLARGSGPSTKGTRLSIAIATLLAGLLAIAVSIGSLQREKVALALATDGALALAGATAVMALLAVCLSEGRRAAARLALLLGTTGLVWAGVSGIVHDLSISHVRRQANAERNRRAQGLDEGALVVTRSAAQFLPQLLRPNSFVSLAGTTLWGGALEFADRELIEFHLEQGRRVYVDGRIADSVIPALDTPAFEAVDVPFDADGLVELRPPSAGIGP